MCVAKSIIASPPKPGPGLAEESWHRRCPSSRDACRYDTQRMCAAHINRNPKGQPVAKCIKWQEIMQTLSLSLCHIYFCSRPTYPRQIRPQREVVVLACTKLSNPTKRRWPQVPRAWHGSMSAQKSNIFVARHFRRVWLIDRARSRTTRPARANMY